MGAVSDNTKNPNPRNLGDYEEGLDDDLEVPTYRRLADDGSNPDVAPDSTDGAEGAAAVPASKEPGLFGSDDDARDDARDAETETLDRPSDLGDPTPHGVTDGTGAGPMAGSAEGGQSLADAATSSGAAGAAGAGAGAGAAGVAGAAAGTPEDEKTQVMPRRDFYAESGRAAPQTIEPGSSARGAADADFAGDPDVTQASPAVGAGGAGEGAAGAAGLGAASARRDDDALDDRDRLDRDGLDSRDDAYRDADATAIHTDPDADYATADDRHGVGAGLAGAGVAGAGAATATGADPDYREDDALHDDRRDRDAHDARAVDDRRGTIDFGLLLLRLGLGGLLLMHGLATFFQFGGAPGLADLEATFADNNYAYAGIIAAVIPTVQIVAGGLLVLGLATPLGAALALAISAFMTMFEVATGNHGWNILAEGAEPVRLQLALTVAALALQFTGPGRYGVDFSRGWARRPLASSWIFCLLAIAAAVGLWYLTSGTLPFVGTTTGASA